MKSTLINNKRVYAFKDKNELLDQLDCYSGLLIALGAEKLLNDNPELNKIINNSLTYCDGYGAVYALKRKGIYSTKIPGAYLWLSIIERFYKTKSFYFLGAKQEVIEKSITKIKDMYKDINISGYDNGYFKNDHLIIDKIYKNKPDIVFVALGSPKQEFFMQSSFDKHNALYVGLGGSFDLFVGKAKKVPDWWNKYFKWEGLYRTITDIKNFKRIKRQKILFHYIIALIKNKI